MSHTWPYLIVALASLGLMIWGIRTVMRNVTGPIKLSSIRRNTGFISDGPCILEGVPYSPVEGIVVLDQSMARPGYVSVRLYRPQNPRITVLPADMMVFRSGVNLNPKSDPNAPHHWL